MKRNIENQIHSLSYEAVRDVARDFELSSETKNRIYFKTLRRTGLRPKPIPLNTQVQSVQTSHRKLNLKKPAVAVAAIALAFSVSMGTMVGAGALNKTFGQYFHSLSESNYQNVLFDINQSQSSNGITVTLTQAMCDGVSLYVIEKVDFDPSMYILTDDMFKMDRDGNCDAPRWGYETLINEKQTEEYEHSALGGIVERMTSFTQILEHSEHSMTLLRVFGGQDAIDTDNFFTDGKKFTVRYANMTNLPGQNEGDELEFRMDISFDMGTVSSPTYYTLPEEVYSVADTADDSFADMMINPWNMRFAPGYATGKILDTSLYSDDKPAVEITMNDGTVYSDKEGIRVYRHPFGGTYDAYQSIYCEFDTPIDTAEIKSVKLYGYEMKKGIVAPDSRKEKKYNTSSEMLDLPAVSEIHFSEDPVTVKYNLFDYYNSEAEIGDFGPDYGQFKYRVKSMKIYDNAYATGAKSIDDLGNDAVTGLNWNKQTGQLGKDWYMLEYEVELTNINAAFNESLSTFDFTNSGCFEQLFHLHSYNYLSPRKGDVYMESYIRENQYALTGQHETIKLDIGETKTFHVAFIVRDNHAGGFEQIGLSVGNDLREGKVEYFNISKIIEDFKNSK